jgi:MFS family permease
VVAHFAHHLLTSLPIPLLPFIRDDFALNYTQAGFVVSAFTLSYGIAQLPAGWFADRIGRRTLITVSICGVAVAGFLVGVSYTYIMMIVFLILMGLAGGGYHPSAAPLIGASVKPENRGRALGFHTIGGSGSFFLAPLIAAAIAAVWGWRGSFIGLAVPTVIFGIILHILLGHRRVTSKQDQMTAHHVEQHAAYHQRWRDIVAFLILIGIVQAVTTSIIAFIPLFIVDNFNVSEEVGASFMAIIYSGGLWASPIGGYVSDRTDRLPIVLTSCFFAGPIIYLLNLTPHVVGAGALLLVLGILMAVRWPSSEAFLISRTSTSHRSAIFGIYYFSGMEIGAVLTPIMGSVIDRFGFNFSFTVVAATLVTVTLICSPFLWNNRD